MYIFYVHRCFVALMSMHYTCIPSACRGQKRVSNIPKLELQAVSCKPPTWVVGTKLESFARAICAQNCLSFSPAPSSISCLYFCALKQALSQVTYIVLPLLGLISFLVNSGLFRAEVSSFQETYFSIFFYSLLSIPLKNFSQARGVSTC